MCPRMNGSVWKGCRQIEAERYRQEKSCNDYKAILNLLLHVQYCTTEKCHTLNIRNIPKTEIQVAAVNALLADGNQLTASRLVALAFEQNSVGDGDGGGGGGMC